MFIIIFVILMELNYTNMKISFAKAIQSIDKELSFTIYNDDLDNIVWNNDNPNNVTKEQILAKQKELQTIEDAKPNNIKKASGKQKLKDLGLDDDEIQALIGV
tara:strand:+ start:365 stop:673 length:309 start_codon:yes stop_codon:yes gene_type:complete